MLKIILFFPLMVGTTYGITTYTPSLWTKAWQFQGVHCSYALTALMVVGALYIAKASFK